MRAFRRHLLAFVLVNGALTAANVHTGAPWWAFWPLIVWAFALMIHFLLYRAATVEDAWIEERTQELRSKSYDLGHMESIRERAALSAKEGGEDPPRPARPG
jgi:hypothetical protein